MKVDGIFKNCLCFIDYRLLMLYQMILNFCIRQETILHYLTALIESKSVQKCWSFLSGIRFYCFCLVLSLLVYSKVQLGLLAYVACFVLFWFWLCYGRLSVSRCFSTSGDVSF